MFFIMLNSKLHKFIGDIVIGNLYNVATFRTKSNAPYSFY